MVLATGFEPVTPPWKGGDLSLLSMRAFNGACDEIRTRKRFLPLPPQDSVYAYSTTQACINNHRIAMGWLTGVEPALAEPQSAVLPLHHNHHIGDTNGVRTRIARLKALTPDRLEDGAILVGEEGLEPSMFLMSRIYSPLVSPLSALAHI